MITPEPRRDAGGDVPDQRRRCFVISPIGEEGSNVRAHADDVLEFIIKPALAKCDLVAVRSDQMAESSRNQARRPARRTPGAVPLAHGRARSVADGRTARQALRARIEYFPMPLARL